MNIFDRRTAPKASEFHGRVASNSSEDGYESYCNLVCAGNDIQVFLNGVEQGICFSADSVDGWVDRAKLNKNGNWYAEGDKVATERVQGNVRIVLKKVA